MSFDLLAIMLSMQLSMHLVHISARAWCLTNAQRVFFQNLGCLLQSSFLPCQHSVQIHGVILTQEQDLAIFFTEFCDTSLSSSL